MRLIALISLLISSSVSADIYTYAPRQKLTQGVKNMACVAVKYEAQPNQGTDAKKCKQVAEQTKNFYVKASRGLLKLNIQAGEVTVPGMKNMTNYNKAVDMAKKMFPNQDIWQVIGTPGPSRAGAKVAQLKGTLYRDAQHEVGHLFGLGHSGRYVEEKGGKWVLKAYGDGQSVMSSLPSSSLAAPQYYSRGWLLKEEAALHVPGTTYEIKRVDNFAKKMLALVIAKRTDGRSVYVSYPPANTCTGDPCLTVHLATGNGGGTQKLATFGKDYVDPYFVKGMKVTVVGKTQDSIKFTIDMPVQAPAVKGKK